MELNPKGKVAQLASFQQYAEMVQERKQRIRGLTARPKKLEPGGIKQWECEGGTRFMTLRGQKKRGQKTW